MYLMHIRCQIKQNAIQYAINCLLNQSTGKVSPEGDGDQNK